MLKINVISAAAMIKGIWMEPNVCAMTDLLILQIKLFVSHAITHVTPAMEQTSITVFHVLVLLRSELILLIVVNVIAWRKDIMTME